MKDDKAAANSIGDLDELNGKSFALVAVEGSGEGACFVGTARWDGEKLFFERPGLLQPVEIPDDQLGSVARTPSELRDLIEADYFVKLTIGNLPDDQPLSEYVRVGIQWPSG